MRRVIWTAAVLCSMVLGIFYKSGFILLSILIVLPTICAIINLIDSNAVECKTQKSSLIKGKSDEIVFAVFGSGNRIKGMLICENTLTHTKSEVPIDIMSSKSGARLSVKIKSEECGCLKFMGENLKRYDFCGLTYKKIKLKTTEKIIVTPPVENTAGFTSTLKAKNAKNQLNAEISGIIGAKEYTVGDDLRLINHKLTHKFAKPYIKEYSTENSKPTCLIFDKCYSQNPQQLDNAAHKLFLTSLAKVQGCEIHYIAYFDNDNHFVFNKIEGYESFRECITKAFSIESIKRESEYTAARLCAIKALGGESCLFMWFSENIDNNEKRDFAE